MKFNDLLASVQVVKNSLKERVESFLENQIEYRSVDKKIVLEGFKQELYHKMSVEGLTDENLLLGLELNNYLNQVDNPLDQGLKLQTVEYKIN